MSTVEEVQEALARPATISAAALQRLALPEPRYAVPRVLPEGLTLFAGRPKCGKSWLAYALALAVASGGVALGAIPVSEGDVLYLALEDNRRRLQARLNQLLDDGPAPERLTLATEWPRLDGDALPLLGEWLDDHPDARLIIVDTLARIRRPHLAGGSVYDADYAALAGLQRLSSARRVSLLVVHHDRKADAADPFDTISGSLGLSGAADSLLLLRRDRETATAQLLLRGRDVEETELGLKWDAARGTWNLLETGEDGALRLVALLQTQGGTVARSDVLHLHHWSAVALDAALAAAGDRVRVVPRPRKDGKPGRPVQMLELAPEGGRGICEVSEVRAVPSGEAAPNFAGEGAKFAVLRPNFAGRHGADPSGDGANFANFANGRVRETV